MKLVNTQKMLQYEQVWHVEKRIVASVFPPTALQLCNISCESSFLRKMLMLMWLTQTLKWTGEKNRFCILTNADMKWSTHAKKKNWNRNQSIMHTLIHSFITILLVKETTYQNSTVPPFTLMANSFLSPFHATLFWTQAARKSQKRCKMPQQSGWFWSKSDFLEVVLLLRSLTPQLVLLWRR